MCSVLFRMLVHGRIHTQSNELRYARQKSPESGPGHARYRRTVVERNGRKEMFAFCQPYSIVELLCAYSLLTRTKSKRGDAGKKESKKEIKNFPNRYQIERL